MSDYLIRNFPPELKSAAQYLAIDKKISLRELILKALTEYIEKHIDVTLPKVG